MELLLPNLPAELPYRSEQAERGAGHVAKRNRQEARQGECLDGFLAVGRTAAVRGKLGPWAGWQGLVGFRGPQQNPSELSVSVYLQIFATKTPFYESRLYASSPKGPPKFLRKLSERSLKTLWKLYESST